MIKSISFFVLLAFSILTADAQPQMRIPRISQGAKISQDIGLSQISISYCRPGVKDRVIWGELVPYDTPWRAGANEPTLITFSDDAMIQGKKLAAGTYRFLVQPSKTGDWMLIFNSEIKNWGTVYEPQFDTLKIMLKPEASPLEEWMSFGFEDLTFTSARVVLTWEKIRFGFTVEFNTLAKLQASVGNWQMLNNAARFALTGNLYLTEALSWAERSIALEKNARNVQTKAELLAKAGEVKEAIAAAEEALALAKAKDPNANTKNLEKMISDWKAKH
jgi:hypothetical protein